MFLLKPVLQHYPPEIRRKGIFLPAGREDGFPGRGAINRIRMARPIKRGLSYFPLNTDLFGNRKIRRLLDRYGCEGATAYLSVLCEIYAEEGYFVPFNRNLCFDIAYLLHLDETRIEEILAFCVNIELFDTEILAKHQALSSQGIQKRYIEVAKRLNRKGVTEALTFEKAPGIFSKETGVSSKETGVLLEETGVSSRNNPTKGNKKKIKKEKTKKENSKVGTVKIETKHETKSKQASSTDEDAERNAELRRMFEAATASK
jgi:hypothetical protein